MQKRIKADGTNYKISLTQEDMKIYELNTGDVVDVVIRKRKEESDETSNKQTRD
jgi:hypothetical protein